MAPSSTAEPPCSSVDSEFWQSQNIAFVVTTALRGGRVCLSANVAILYMLFHFVTKARRNQGRDCGDHHACGIRRRIAADLRRRARLVPRSRKASGADDAEYGYYDSCERQALARRCIRQLVFSFGNLNPR